MRTLIRYCFALLSALALAVSAAAAPSYTIVPLGLNDFEHTRNDGYKYSTVGASNGAGQVAGHSPRYNSGGTSLGQSVWFYNGASTINVGLTGPEHTRNDGYKLSSRTGLSQTGQVAGYSYRYNGSSGDLGQTAWLYDGATTIDIGLVGSEYTRANGYKHSYPHTQNPAGQVAGYSSRFNGPAELGQTVWLYDGTTTIDIGLTGAEHTRNDGYRSGWPSGLNAAGQVSGYSRRFNGGSTDLGQTTWLYDGQATIAIGLAGAEHTRSNGYKFSDVRQLNQAGQVRGHSDRFNGGSTNLGQSAWLYNGATTIDIGLAGGEHTRADGYKYSLAYALYQTGKTTGISYRYGGGTANLGWSAWLHDGNTTMDVGLTGPEHTRNDGYKFSSPGPMNDAGRLTGYSDRYNGGGVELGQTAWLYDGAATIDIGLVDSEHTRDDGYKSSVAQQLNEAGLVSGFSSRFNGGSTDLGRSTWFYDGNTTIDIGLTDSQHTRSDGYRFSESLQLNEAGQVGGNSYRYNGSAQVGRDAWLYDPVLNQTLVLNYSTRSDGYTFSRVDYLGDDGLVLGSYTLFDAQDNNLGDRAFYFTISDGLHDLGSLVAGGLAANGWDYLTGDSAIKPVTTARANALDQIVGFGKLTSQSGGLFAFLLNPVGGDFNGDGAIDAADYVLWRKNSEMPGDYETWRANFGTMSGTGAATPIAADAVVPEPATAPVAALAILIAALIARYRHDARS